MGIALAALMTLAGTARAQEGESRAIAKGRWSLAFSLPNGGGGQFGVWKMVSGRSNLGVNLGIGHDRETHTDGPDTLRSGRVLQSWTFSFEPNLECYLSLKRDVSPFVFAALKGSYGWFEDGAFFKAHTRSATLRVGLGAEWTPLESISIGGSTGIAWTESMTSYSEYGAPKDSDSSFNTLASALTLHLYF